MAIHWILDIAKQRTLRLRIQSKKYPTTEIVTSTNLVREKKIGLFVNEIWCYLVRLKVNTL